MLIAGPLSDKILEPAMQNPESALASATGWFMGIGPGRGMALLFVIGGCVAALVGLCGYMFRVLRDVDILMPDFDTLQPVQDTQPTVIPTDERLYRMQELLEERRSWAAQPASPERELALKAISNSLRKLGQGVSKPPEAA